MWRRLFAEGLCTCLLCFTIVVSHLRLIYIPGAYYSAYCTAGTIMALMIFSGFTSGAHFNPAATVGYCVYKFINSSVEKADFIEYGMYIVVQFVCAIPGAYIGWAINEETMYFDLPHDYDSISAFLAEMVYTTLIVGCALMVGHTNDSIVIVSSGVATALFGGVLGVGLISGACFNPAVGLAANLVHYSNKQDHFGHTWIYIIAPLLGGIIAALLSTVFIQEMNDQKKKKSILREESQGQQ
ncbi:unnamed protein product [Blepharisma stoltei]|uniref:Aquaporin n=1 Tax=Blepharisma stoltei TaxID=1481888 RepID=A0AAU9K8P4_9CILI|nr:unnamed protein product [Blepharisma stoltei]